MPDKRAIRRLANLAQRLQAAEQPLERAKLATEIRDLADGLIASSIRDANRAGTTWREIGSELGVPDMRDFTLITSSYASADHTTGFLGIIGPTRMEYERGISIVGYLGRLIGEMINA